MNRNFQILSAMIKNGAKCSDPVVQHESFFPNLNCKRYDASTDLDNIWMVGLIHHSEKEKQHQLKKDVNALLQLPESTVLPIIKTRLTKLKTLHVCSSKIERQKSSRQDTFSCVMTANLNERRSSHINHLKNQLEEKNQVKQIGTKLLVSAIPYRKANSQINFVLSETKKNHASQMKSSVLEEILKINRNESEAIITVQKQSRKKLAMNIKNRLKEEMKASTRIQAMVRGFFERIRYNTFRRKVLNGISLCQACVRMMICVKKRQLILNKRNSAAILCQSIIRSLLAKCILKRRRRRYSATRIQTVWRCSYCFRRYMVIRKNHYIVNIQSRVRGIQSRQIFDVLRCQKNFSATKIERLWRGYCARKLQKDLQNSCEIERLQYLVRLIKAEAKYWCGQESKEDCKIKDENNDLLQLKNDIIKKIKKARMEIEVEERNFVELNKLRQNTTPKLIVQGWKKITKDNIRKCKRSIRAKKMYCILNLKLKDEKIDKKIKSQGQKIIHFKRDRERWNQLYDDQLKKCCKYGRDRSKEEDKIKKLKQVAHEKRRWKVLHKIEKEKQVRLGKPHDGSSLKVPFNSGSSSGCIEEFSFEDKRKWNIELESKEQSLMKLIDEIKLQSYLKESQEHDNLWNPISTLILNSIATKLGDKT